ncbi:MAG: hypothetical protein ACOY3K_03145 [Candidatus Omnitrophota bacterium]
MTYEKIFELKFERGFTTHELAQRFPKEIRRVSEVALLELPDEMLQEVMPEKDMLKRVRLLRKRFQK